MLVLVLMSFLVVALLLMEMVVVVLGVLLLELLVVVMALLLLDGVDGVVCIVLYALPLLLFLPLSHFLSWSQPVQYWTD